ncbi:MAG TPA: HAD family hydrolase [Candidatus Anaerofilum faecale]|nr:HAD family hydrolase [Candidatus Anaerofilum faecale]
MAQTQLVLWDWNGTLLNDLQLSIQALNRLLAENGYPQQFDTRAYRKIFGFPIQDYYRRAGFDFSRHPYDRLAQRYMEMYIPASEGCRLSPGAKDVLAQLQKQGMRQVILSASPLDLLRHQVSAQGLEGFFEKLLGLSDIYAVSKVQLGVDWMQQSGIDPQSAVMVGDSLHDAEVAAAMGVRCVLYAGGHQSPSRLAQAGCPVIERLRQLPQLLAEE